MTTAYVMIDSGEESIQKISPLMGKRPMYWTKAGITIFFFPDDEGDWVPTEGSGRAGYLVKALPGMVGTNWQGNSLYVITRDNECVTLTNLDDAIARTLLEGVLGIRSVDQQAGEVSDAG